MESKKKKDYRDNFRNASISGGMVETVDRFGSANKEHLVAYSGIDNERSKVLKKGLERTASSKAGFSAEDKTVARANAEAIIEKRTERMVRTDDIGRVNDPLYDTVIIDRDGNIVEGSGTQLKFVGAAEKDPSGKYTAKRVVDYLKNSKKEFSNEILNDLDFESFENIIILDKQTIDFPFSKGQIIPSNFSSVQFQIKISEISNFLQNDFSRKIFEVPDVQNSKQVQKITPLTSKSPLLDKDCSKCIALTFDDGPGIYTDKLLSYLQSYKAKATFFMIGPSAQRYPSIVKRVFDNGHQIGNHTWSHPSLPGLSPAQVQNEISSTNNILQGITGVKPTTLRPPYGATNAAVQRVVSNLGMSSILWSVDTRDWADRNSNIVCNRAISNARPGAIILMHDIHRTSVDAVPCILQNLSSQGYQFVTVDKLLGNLQPGSIYYSAK